MDRLLVIAGPTAVGKTGLTIELAEELGAEIISADSMQVYRGMDIGTAKAVREERERVRHHLIDILDVGDHMSAAQFQKLARDLISDINGRGKLPILTGGTGLYIRAVVDPYNFTPLETDWKLRQRLREEIERVGLSALHERLSRVDAAAAARISPNDARRIIRALEVHEQTGRPLSCWEQMARDTSPRYDALFVCLTLPRDLLYRRIEERVDNMLAEGLVEEVRGLAALDWSFVSSQALGYKELLPFLEGRISLPEASERIKMQTRRYAKRQLSWFRADERYTWVDAVDSSRAYREVRALVADRWHM